ncbi:MAG: S9 family peptidase [Phycisphaerales bacterium]|nr:MAG: S9 family peptidase [Phycisphaerales bacterium]
MFDRPRLPLFSATSFTLLAALVVASGCTPNSLRTQTAFDQSVEMIPREIFFGNPDRASLQLSPDGTRLAYLAPLEGVMNVWVQTVGEEDARPITRSEDRPIRSYFWAYNNEQILYTQDRDGDENFRIYAVDLDTRDEIVLTPFDGVQARVIATDRDAPDEILAAINNRVPQFHDVWRINTRTGEKEMVYENQDGWLSFLPDSDFNLRLATRMNQEGGSDVFVRPAGSESWELLVSWDMEDAMNSNPLGFARDNETLYIADSRDGDTSGLYACLIDDSLDLNCELIARDDRADFSGIFPDAETGHVLAVSFEYDRVEWNLLDDSIRADWDRLSRIADGDFSVTSRSLDDKRWTVAYVVDDGPVRYYLYDRESGEASFLFTNRTDLESRELASMEPVVIEARDGLKLVSYLTLPPRREAKDLPMVLLVHGGPWARDRWGYNSTHQWLANRGYAVLSVNFRGSTGFGKAFMNAGNREWAGAMHDDLIDAVEWAVAEGIADRDRVAIMGGSYGGYAALVGMTFTPEVFAAGISIVGPSHVGTLLETIPPYWEPMKVFFETRVGSLDDPEYLDSISPLTYVDRIQRPLLIGQGANDPRVKESESEQIVRAMQERGIPVTYVLFPDEGHGFARPENRLAFNAVTEAFLAEHLGGRFEPIGRTVDESSAKIPEGAALIPNLDVSDGE